MLRNLTPRGPGPHGPTASRPCDQRSTANQQAPVPTKQISQVSQVGFPIRKSSDQRVFAPPRRLSQRITSFIACACQGIHQLPLRHLIVHITNIHQGKAPISLATKRPASRDLLDGAVRQTNHMAGIERSQPTNAPMGKPEQIFSLRCQTEQAPNHFDWLDANSK